MHRFACSTGLLICALLFAPTVSVGGSYVFDTQSLATQTLSSPLFGSNPVTISATGLQHFSLDLGTGAANVTSDFKGTDLPDPLSPGGFLNYDLYNTPASTTGTVVLNGMGQYDITFTLLFELKITSSGILDGQTFETMQLATFAALGVPTLPFPSGTVFADPNQPDTVAIFAKTSLPGVYNAGDLIGTSSGRTVTILEVVPEPASIVTFGVGTLFIVGFAWCRRRVNHVQLLSSSRRR